MKKRSILRCIFSLLQSSGWIKNYIESCKRGSCVQNYIFRRLLSLKLSIYTGALKHFASDCTWTERGKWAEWAYFSSGIRARAASSRGAAARAPHSMPEHDKYQLRPRAARAREPRARRTPQPLSKYRRKTANARERSRMREINRAFEALRRAVPAAAITGTPVPCEKLTKITTLRLAMRYISALSAALNSDTESRPERWPSPFCSDLSEFSTEMEQETTSEFAEDSLSPFDSFFAEFDCEYVDRTFAWQWSDVHDSRDWSFLKLGICNSYSAILQILTIILLLWKMYFLRFIYFFNKSCYRYSYILFFTKYLLLNSSTFLPNLF